MCGTIKKTQPPLKQDSTSADKYRRLFTATSARGGRTEVSMSDNIIVLTEENYDEEVLGKPGLIVIDFYSDSCTPCKLMEPAFAEVALKYEGLARFAKINVYDSMKLALKNKVMGMPTLLFFKDGEEADRVSTGPLDAIQLKGRVDALI
jgi:thioredoxin 1